MARDYADATAAFVAAVIAAFVVTAVLYEWLAGKYEDNKKTKEDWMSNALGFGGTVLIQRPLAVLAVFVIGAKLFPQHAEALRWLDQDYFWPVFLGLLLLDELLHGYFHRVAHMKPSKNAFFAKIQNVYKGAHRIHHTSGGNDGKGEVNVLQGFSVNWCWFLLLPNYTVGVVALYAGLYESYFWVFAVKNIWSLHTHTNWNYDLYLLNHRNPIVRNIMFGLCHILVFPTMHHHHHSRGRNSGRNYQPLLAVYDWLLWDSLAIETARPKTYGWRQTQAEEFNVVRRWLNTGQYPR